MRRGVVVRPGRKRLTHVGEGRKLDEKTWLHLFYFEEGSLRDGVEPRIRIGLPYFTSPLLGDLLGSAPDACRGVTRARDLKEPLAFGG